MRCRYLLVLSILLLFVVGCVPQQELSDKNLEKELSNLPDEELKELASGEGKEAIAGQASYNVRFKASNQRVSDAAKKILENRNLKQNKIKDEVFKTDYNKPDLEVSFPPVLDPIGDRSVKENELLTFKVTAADVNAKDVLTYSVQGLPAGAGFDANSQVFNWVPTHSQGGVYPVTFKVSDGKYEDNEKINIMIRTCVDKPNGLISWWDGDKVNGSAAYDLVGEHHGTLANGAKIGTGIVGNAFDFSNSNGYVSVAHNSDFNIGYNWFADAWVMPKSFPAPGNRGAIIMKWVDGAENKALEIGSDGKAFITLVKMPSAVVQLIATTPLLKDRFNLVAAGYNGTDLKIYINGKLDNSMPLSMDVSDSTGVLYIGNHPTRGAGFVPFDGLIDEVEWGTAVPTDKEIEQLFYFWDIGKCKP